MYQNVLKGKEQLSFKIKIEEIVGFLNAGDFSRCRWYDSCKLIRSKIEPIDEIFWAKESQKLAAVLRLKNMDFKKQWPGKTSLEIFLIHQRKVEELEIKIRGMLDLDPVPHKESDIADAASLAYHGILGHLQRLPLSNVDLSSIPTLHLVSLATCAKDTTVSIRNVKMKDQIQMVTFLDSVDCELLVILQQRLNTEETQALVRAMIAIPDERGVDLEELVKSSMMEEGNVGRWTFLTMTTMTKNHITKNLGSSIPGGEKIKRLSLTGGRERGSY